MVNVLVIIIVIVAAVVGYAATRPDVFNISRSMLMEAPAEKIFAHINDLQQWSGWSPWIKLDPNAKVTLEGPRAGVGAISRWDGNAKMGAGSMTIIESAPNDHITLRLDFIKPFEGTATSTFTFKPEAGGTNVTWSMTGKQNLLQKVMGLIMNCDQMIGDTYLEGLTSIRKIVEK